MSKELLFSVTKKDCRWDYYRGTGAGGQKKNKTSNCVRCTHNDSGAVGKSEDGRSQSHNKKAAFRKMAESSKFKGWIKLEKAKRMGIEARIEDEAKQALHPKNMRVETKDADGKWVENKDL